MVGQKRTLILAATALAVSTTVVVGASYALFSGGAEVNNHLKAGNLKVGLTRSAYTAYLPNEEGLMAEISDDKPIDLVKESAPVFNVEGAVPTCWYEAEITVANQGSVAFTHGMRILWTEEGKSAEEKLFASQMKITVAYEGTKKQFALVDCADSDLDLGILLRNQTTAFTVKAEFLNVENNDAVQNTALNFDVQVFATQYVGEE